MGNNFIKSLRLQWLLLRRLIVGAHREPEDHVHKAAPRHKPAEEYLGVGQLLEVDDIGEQKSRKHEYARGNYRTLLVGKQQEAD